ncbi:hypothetical protein F4782DRAFT_45985 [Xylaria castorea]|nr:hypothetical protein F4782DRAFT_45985 [Xylaria castorea]
MPYRDARYPLLLQAKGSYMAISELGITDKSKQIIWDFFSGETSVPQESPFDNNILVHTGSKLDNHQYEAKVIRDVSRLIVPSVHSLAARAMKLRCLTESVNQGWNNSIPLTSTRPQPDYSVDSGERHSQRIS